MPNLVHFDCYEVDVASGQLYKHGVRIPLREKSFALLIALLEHPGELVSREELRRRLWHDDVFVDFDNNLNTVLVLLCYKKGAPQKGQLDSCRSSTRAMV